MSSVACILYVVVTWEQVIIYQKSEGAVWGLQEYISGKLTITHVATIMGYFQGW